MTGKSNMQYLITGVSGFIGNNLYKTLKLKQDNSPGQFIDDAIFGMDKVIGLDILNEKSYDMLDKWVDFHGSIDYIYHLAGQTSVNDSFSDMSQDAKDNILTMIELIKRFPNAKIIYTQTSACVPEKGKIWQIIDIIKGRQYIPNSPYGLSKKTAGDYLKAFHNDYVICYLPNVYGEGGKGVVDIFKKTDDVDIYGDGEQKRTFVSVNDIVEGLIKAQDWQKGEYFMGGTKPVSVNELAFNKRVVHKKARQEVRESIIPNTTPDWKPIINVKDYLKQN